MFANLVYLLQQNQISFLRQPYLLYQSMIFKLTFNNQTHLYNKSISIQSITNFTKKVFRGVPDSFTFIYQSTKGQMTYVETDQDLIGLKYLCSSSNDFIIKLLIMKTERSDQIYDEEIQTLNIVKENIKKIQDDIFTDLEEQANQEAIKENLKQMYERISKNIVQQEEKILNKEVRIYLSNLYEITSNSSALVPKTFVEQKPKSRKTVRFSPQKPVIYESPKSIESQINIDELVNKKVMEIIPSIVQKIYVKIEQRIKDKCKNCLNKEYQIQKLIDKQISKRIQMSCSNICQNPQE